MKILLIGEYSRLHNSLKEGLEKNGHNVTLVGSGDGFKNYPVDIKLDSYYFNLKLLKPISNTCYYTKSICSHENPPNIKIIFGLIRPSGTFGTNFIIIIILENLV